jgi:hypothetical protein
MINSIRHRKIQSLESVSSDQRRFFLMALLVATFLMPIVVTAKADSRSDAIWKVFRQTHPYHVQTVGLSDASRSGERVLIISEPPPLIRRSQYTSALRVVFGAALQNVELKKNPVGIDGWCEDIVATLAYANIPESRVQLSSDMTRLAARLFGTAYKFAPIRLLDQATAQNSSDNARLQAPPNLQISAAELDSWLLTSAQKVTELETGAEYVVRDLLKNGSPGVYLSQQRGLVLLLLPRQAKLNAHRVAIREFTLDTDAIVGAIATGEDRLAIIGRERDTPLAAVPPLRTEMILALAATRQKQLGQSYERLAPFAGELESGPLEGRDWAPIYLSKDLFNSEFGSLLNLTDQMLKGWSQAGAVHYINFNYVPSAPYPFPDGVVQHLEADQLTFNWNTIGVGAIVHIRDAQIFTVHRTGALPVSYCPGETCNSEKERRVVDAEETAYNWFSGLRDPYLGRVVQYTSLYQIFRAFPVDADRDEAAPENTQAPSKVLAGAVLEGLNNIINGKIAALIDRKLTEVNAEAAQLPPILRESIAAPLVEQIAAIRKQADATATTLGKMREQCDNNTLENFAALIADRNAEHDSIRCRRSFSVDFPNLRRTIVSVLSFASNTDAIRLAYMDAAKPVETGYIKTPSIVLSWASGGTGGHNLYSRATRIESRSDVVAGQVRIERSSDQTILLINPKDEGHAADLARAYERSGGRSETDLARILRDELASVRPVRPQSDALAIADRSPSAERGLTVKGEGDLTLGNV